jgi:predicted metal-dependent peptidase
MSTRSSLRPPDDGQKILLAAWTALALDRCPYLASILYSLRPVNAPGTGTFAVDEHHRLYIDFETVAAWGADGCSQALLHEAMHLAYQHADEAREMNVQPAERMRWNLAADAAANDDLRDAGCDFIASEFILPEKIGCDDYQTASAYLAELRLRRQDQGDEDAGGSGDDPGAGESQGGSSQEDGQGGDGDATDGGNYQGCGSGAGSGPAPWELSAGDDLDGQAPPAQAGEKAVIAQSLAEAVQEASKSRGDIPAGLTAWAEKTLAKPTVPWQRVLAPLIRRYTAIRAGEYDSTYARRNRRCPYTRLGSGRVVNPGVFAPVPRIAFVRDTSGSMTDDDLNLVGAEIESVAARLGIRGRDLLVIDADADAYTPRPYKALDGLREVQGRGGTDMRAGIAAAVKLKPSVIIVATDGYTPWDEHPSTRVPVVACLIGSQYDDGKVSPDVIADVPKWMRTVVVEPGGDTGRR